MENPLDAPLNVKLEVDAKIADSWYEGKWLIKYYFFNLIYW